MDLKNKSQGIDQQQYYTPAAMLWSFEAWMSHLLILQDFISAVLSIVQNQSMNGYMDRSVEQIHIISP